MKILNYVVNSLFTNVRFTQGPGNYEQQQLALYTSAWESPDLQKFQDFWVANGLFHFIYLGMGTSDLRIRWSTQGTPLMLAKY